MIRFNFSETHKIYLRNERKILGNLPSIAF